MARYLVTISVIAAIFSVPATSCYADIYRYVDDEGVTCFTDAPASRKAVVFMKDHSNRPPKSRGTIPPHLEGTGIAEKVGMPTAATNDSNISFLPINGRITSLTGFRHDPIDGKLRLHNGVDIAVPSGTPVRPASPGTVVFSGTRSGYGNLLIIAHADGTITLYAHNSANLVSEGSQVDQGTVIALSGSTGRSTGPHLHFEAWKDGVNITSTYIDGSAQPAVTAAALKTRDTIRRMVGADGSLTFTNMH